jgi:hypothetical protein
MMLLAVRQNALSALRDLYLLAQSTELFVLILKIGYLARSIP